MTTKDEYQHFPKMLHKGGNVHSGDHRIVADEDEEKAHAALDYLPHDPSLTPEHLEQDVTTAESKPAPAKKHGRAKH